MSRNSGSSSSGIKHARECDACGAETYQFEQCHECGDIPWLDGDRVSEGGTEQSEEGVQWVVVANYCDDPHPHVLGTFADRDDAEDLLADCGHRFNEPHVDAWTLWKLVADEEPEMVSP